MGREEPGDSHPIINEWGGTWAGPGQVWVVWNIPGKPNFPYSQPASNSRQEYSKKFFLRLLKGGSPSSVSASSRKGAADPTYKGKLSLGAHLVSESLPSTVKSPHGDLGCSWKSHCL
jgi:hypothetical protein